MSNFMQPIHFRVLFVFTPLVFALTGCSETLHSQRTIPIKTSSESIAYPEVDTVLGEKLQPNEDVLAQNIAQVVNNRRREMLYVMRILKHMGVCELNFMSQKIYLLSSLKAFLYQTKVIKHGFAFLMLLMTPLVLTLTKMHVA